MGENARADWVVIVMLVLAVLIVSLAAVWFIIRPAAGEVAEALRIINEILRRG